MASKLFISAKEVAKKSNIDAMVVDDFGFSQYDYARNVSSWLFISDDKK